MIRTLLSFASTRLATIRERRRREWIDRLCARGMRLGKNVVVMHDVSFDSTYPWLIEIGDGCRISTGVRIMAHDATPLHFLGVSRLGRVRILEDSFISERCIILPGVTIGPRAIVAAGSVVGRDVGEGMLAAGNPARVYGRFDEYLDRTAAAARSSITVDVGDLTQSAIRADVRSAMDRDEQVFVRGIDSDMAYFHNISAEDVRAAASESYARLRAAADRLPTAPERA